MDTSDDPGTIAVLVGAGATVFSATQKPKTPDVPWPDAPVTAKDERTKQREEERGRRRRLATSVMTQNWVAPTLSSTGALGL